MRGAYHHQGRGGPGYQHSPPYPAHNQYSPHNQSPYHGGRGGWSGNQYSNQGSPMHGYSPNQSPYHQNQSYSPGYPSNQPYPQNGYSSGPYRGGRGSHYNGPDRRPSGPGPHTTFGQGGRGRGAAPTQFSNLSWTPASGTRGGRPATEAPRPNPPPVSTSTSTEAASVDADDNPFRPSKDLRVEDEGKKEEQKMPPPTKPTTTAPTQPKSGFSFSLKTKNPVPVASKAKAEEPEKVEPKTKESLLEPKKDVAPRDPRHPSDVRNDRDRDYNYEQTYEIRETHAIPPPPSVPKTVMVKRTRVKERPTLSADFAASESVYYRKPGNESVVGSGTYGKVFKGIHVYTKDQVALKKIRMEGERDGFPVTAIREVKLLQSLNHDNIVKLREVMVEKNDCYMVFEYLSHDLTGLLNHPTFKLEESHKKDLAKQLFEGLDYLHRRGVLHRDIKAANILVSNTGQLKLADFGLARFYAKRSKLDYTNRVITIWYRSPELLLGETQYGPAVDIWSAACVLVEIFTRHAIFPGDGGEINQLDKIYNILGTPAKEDWPGIVDMQWFNLLRPTERKPSTFEEKYRHKLSASAFELLSAMFLYDPAARPTASDVLEHPFFASELPAPERASALKELEGDWHEFESKALRKEKEREARRAAREEGKRDDAGKRRADGATDSEREAKRVKSSEGTQ
ncbi:kinase subunit of RNA polymerase II carboxy-terminal domain kinase I [Curvularia kusanoi]|uniref:cyclin-dependent kinase n=1 Tax=Curvularia kusanoi TaxID=90978 RepID=A0A9P4TL35_CURKU|nr:kinase subunit of RNA polymerase II carboxy-terminal domain kinase I [Curvularia kusanoi]